jgi:integrase
MNQPACQFIDGFLEHSEKQEINEKTKENRREVLNLLRNHLEKKNEDIYFLESSKVELKIDNFFDENDSRSPNPPNIHAITSFFDYLKKEKDLYDSSRIEQSKNAVLTLKKTYEESNAVQRIEKGKLSYDEREKLIRACRSSDKELLKKEVMLRLILDAGLSRSELLTLKPEDIMKEETVNPAEIRVNREWSQTKGKEIEKDESRYVAISLDTRIRINELIDKEDRELEDFLIWENPNYRKPKRRLDEILGDAGLEDLDVSIKDLQRNVIIDLVEKGVEQHRIQKYYGSKSSVTGDIVDKFSLENPSSYPLARNKRVF